MQPEQLTPSNTPDHAAGEGAVDALQRRRLLLRGLGKGAAVAAVVAPIQSLATPDPLAARLCTVSGVQSNVGSGRSGGTTEQCSGYPQSHFATLSNWPGYVPGPPASASYSVSGIPYTEATPFNTIFGAGASSANPQMLAVFTSGSGSEKTWAAALLSAIKKQAGGLGPSASGSPGYFPYTPEEVRDLYVNAATPSARLAAEAFFAQYLVPPA